MLTRLLCGVVISSVFFVGLEECVAKKAPISLSGILKQKKAAGEGKRQEQKSLSEQKKDEILNNFGFTSLSLNYSSIFSRSADSWKEFRKTKKKDAMYPDIRRSLEESCKMRISELVSALKSEGFITEITPEPIKDTQKEAKRKSVYIALKDLSKTLEKYNSEFIKMTNEQAKKYESVNTEVMDPSIAEKLKNDEVFTTKADKLKQKAGNDITKLIVVLCKLLKVTKPEDLAIQTKSPLPDNKRETGKADPVPVAVDVSEEKTVVTDEIEPEAVSVPEASAKAGMAPPPPPPLLENKHETEKVDISKESIPTPPPLVLSSETADVVKSTASNSLLGDIEKGDFKLRKVDPSAPRPAPSPAVKAHGKPDPMETLRQVMAQRRADLKDDGDDDTEEDPWED